MTHKLPPLFTLQAFEAAARLSSFSRAASELHLTPGAISKQIRQLEEWSQQTLFKRVGPRVSLTEDGHALLTRLAEPLAALHQAIYPVAGSQQKTLHISTLASFAKAWLLPRLSEFNRLHPDIRLVIDTHYSFVKAAPRLAMLALRYGGKEEADYRRQLLFDDRLVAVCSPALLKQIGNKPTCWPAHCLLRHLPLDPQPWLDQAGLDVSQVKFGLAFNDSDVLLEAAQQAQGVALARLSIAWPRLQQGGLVQAATTVSVSAQNYYLVSREDSANLPEVRAFSDWILNQASQWQAQLQQFDKGRAEAP